MGVRIKKFRSGRLHVHILPVLVWLAALAGVVTLFSHRAMRFEILGIAQGQVRQVAATTTGRIKTLSVELFEKVDHDQIVAILDTLPDNEPLQAQLATASAEIQHLKAQLVATRQQLLTEEANLESGRIVTKRRFAVDIESARLRILELKTLIETDQLMLEELAVEIKIVIELLDDHAVAPYEFQKVEVQYNTLSKKIEENQNLFEQATRDLKTSQKRYDEFASHQLKNPPMDATLNVIRKAIKVQQQRTEELLAKRNALVLKAPFDGIVSLIHRRPGETVLAGEPILTITEAKPTQIIAYINEALIEQAREKKTVKLIKNSNPPQIINSQVVSLGPNMELIPQRLWQNPSTPQWGRPMLIKIPPNLKLMPGEKVGIRGL